LNIEKEGATTMDVNLWFNYHTGKATELRNAVLSITQSKAFLSRSEIKEKLPQSLRGFLDCDQPRFLDVTIDNLALRDGLLEVGARDGIEVFRRVH
jgi:hypothetical protein